MKKLDKDLGYVLVFLIAVAAGCAYVHHSKTVFVLDGTKYLYVGMARLPTDQEIYTPVYKRLK
jgi:hypothetical protein